MDLVRRDQVMVLLKHYGANFLCERVAELPCFPTKETAGRNAVGQTEEEFWSAAEGEI